MYGMLQHAMHADLTTDLQQIAKEIEVVQKQLQVCRGLGAKGMAPQKRVHVSREYILGRMCMCAVDAYSGLIIGACPKQCKPF